MSVHFQHEEPVLNSNGFSGDLSQTKGEISQKSDTERKRNENNEKNGSGKSLPRLTGVIVTVIHRFYTVHLPLQLVAANTVKYCCDKCKYKAVSMIVAAAISATIAI